MAAEPKAPSGTSLGELLKQRGVAVGDAPPQVTPSSQKEPPLDFGGATKIVLRRERKGHGGKTVTVVEGFRLPPSALEKIARELKRALGCGATLDGARIIVQG